MLSTANNTTMMSAANMTNGAGNTRDAAGGRAAGGAVFASLLQEVQDLLARILPLLVEAIADKIDAKGGGRGRDEADCPGGPGPNPGNILGGTNAMGDFIDPRAADFTRRVGDLPVAELSVRELG